MSQHGVIVRDEHAGEADAIHVIHERAFPTPLEARLVDALRDAGASVISQVAVRSGAIVGHVLLTAVHIEQAPRGVAVLGLAPIGVLPEEQNQGIGAQLMLGAIERARMMRLAAIVLVGEPSYYSRFGFVPAKQFGLRCKWPGTEEAFMALELSDSALTGSKGLVSYHDLFDTVG